MSAPLAWESKAGYCVSHRHGSVSWRVCVSTPRARRSSDRLQSFTPPGLLEPACVSVCIAMALGAGGCQCFTPPGLLELAGVSVCTARAIGGGGCQCFTPPGLLELACVSVCTATALEAGGFQCFTPPGFSELAGVSVCTASVCAAPNSCPGSMCWIFPMGVGFGCALVVGAGGTTSARTAWLWPATSSWGPRCPLF